jgi:hypothetical protein
MEQIAQILDPMAIFMDAALAQQQNIPATIDAGRNDMLQMYGAGFILLDVNELAGISMAHISRCAVPLAASGKPITILQVKDALVECFLTVCRKMWGTAVIEKNGAAKWSTKGLWLVFRTCVRTRGHCLPLDFRRALSDDWTNKAFLVLQAPFSALTGNITPQKLFEKNVKKMWRDIAVSQTKDKRARNVAQGAPEPAPAPPYRDLY